MNGFKVMGTGSRSMVHAADRQFVYDNLRLMVVKIRERHPDLVLISGMAEGWDEAIAKVGQKLSIPYIVVIPTDDYGDYYWRRNSQLKRDRFGMYDLLVRGASEKIRCEDIYGPYKMTKWGPMYVMSNGDEVHANKARNQVMVNMCDMALVYKPNSTGTRDAVARLVTAQKPYLVSPFNMQETLF